MEHQVRAVDAPGVELESIAPMGSAANSLLDREGRRPARSRHPRRGGFTGLLLGSVSPGLAPRASTGRRRPAPVELAPPPIGSIATVVAMALPYALARSGRDPAYGSGPLATVIQDLLSVIVYFAIATALI